MPNAKTLTTVSAQRLRTKACELSRAEGRSRFALAEVIHDLYYGVVEVGSKEVPLFKFFGFKTWFDYVESDEVGLHVSTAAGYRAVWDVFGVKLAGQWDRELMLPFTKMRALTRVVDATNVNSWLKRAARLTCCALEDEIAGKSKRRQYRHFAAFVTDHQLARVVNILDRASDEFPDLTTRGDLLVKVLEQWHGVVKVGKTYGKKLRLAKAG